MGRMSLEQWWSLPKQWTTMFGASKNNEVYYHFNSARKTEAKRQERGGGKEGVLWLSS